MNNYCTHVRVSESVRLDLFTPTCFRVRQSRLGGEKFPDKYEIPFAVGRTEPWDGVDYEEIEEPCAKSVKTSYLTIEVRSTDGYRGTGFVVYDRHGKRIFPFARPSTACSSTSA